LLLDDDTRVLNVNRSLAGTSFHSISEDDRKPLHEQAHPGCGGNCRFAEMWNKAWSSLENRGGVEWEIDDEIMNCLLRLNLSMPPTANNVDEERRQRHALLTITDITKYRREHQSLIERERALVKLLSEQGVQLFGESDVGYDDEGDTGNRLMARPMKNDLSFNRQIILAQESERKRIASDLHDGIAQTIGVAKYKVEAGVAQLAKRDPGLDLKMFDTVIDQLKLAVEELRRISSNLAPSMLDDFGICVALDWLCNEVSEQNVDIRAKCVTCVDEGATPDIIKIAIYRVVQEALNNAAKHSSASRVDVSLDSMGERVTVLIADNGSGFDLRSQLQNRQEKPGLGLRSMRERVEATGGFFDIESKPRDGVVIRAEWVKATLHLIE
jgi:signal transduction histidine kinase